MGNPQGVVRASEDGTPLEIDGGVALLPLVKDGREHRVEIELGALDGTQAHVTPPRGE